MGTDCDIPTICTAIDDKKLHSNTTEFKFTFSTQLSNKSLQQRKTWHQHLMTVDPKVCIFSMVSRFPVCHFTLTHTHTHTLSIHPHLSDFAKNIFY